MRKITAAACSDKGRLRSNNEDSFFLDGQFMPKQEMDTGGLFTALSSQRGALYAVCDGMGGQASGEEASFGAVSLLRGLKASLGGGGDVRAGIDSYVARANDAVLSVDGSRSAGSTLVLLYLDGSKATVAHLGDSRAYLCRRGALERLTEDHSEVQRLLSLGVLSPEEARRHPSRHALLRYLGYSGAGYALRAVVRELDVKNGDMFLLCSDGLTDMLTDAEILPLLRGAPEEASKALVQAALAAGGKDNVTALVVKAEKLGFTLFRHDAGSYGHRGSMKS